MSRDQPVTRVSWFAASAYWEARGARLPTETEREYAARATETEPDRPSRPGGTHRFTRHAIGPMIPTMDDILGLSTSTLLEPLALPPGALHCFMTGFGLLTAAMIGMAASLVTSGLVALASRSRLLHGSRWLPCVPLGALAVPLALVARIDAREWQCFVDDIGMNAVGLAVLAIDAAIPVMTFKLLRTHRNDAQNR